MTSPTNTRLCELSTRLEQDWRELYATAFPLAEQESEQKLQQLIDDGRLLYHKTIGKQGELLCFSMVSLAPDFSFLAYIATDPKQRSGGYGSKHMRALIDLLKQQYPTHVGMLLEIESTNPRNQKLTEEEKNIRQRRLSFYRRLGSKRLCRNMQYLTPSLQGAGEHELDILFFNFSVKTLDHKEKERIVAEIYQRFYGLTVTDLLVSRVLARISGCSHQKCEEEASDPAPLPDTDTSRSSDSQDKGSTAATAPDSAPAAAPPATPSANDQTPPGNLPAPGSGTAIPPAA